LHVPDLPCGEHGGLYVLRIQPTQELVELAPKGRRSHSAIGRFIGHYPVSGQAVRVLNIAGPREEGAPGIHAESFSFLLRLLK